MLDPTLETLGGFSLRVVEEPFDNNWNETKKSRYNSKKKRAYVQQNRKWKNLNQHFCISTLLYGTHIWLYRR